LQTLRFRAQWGKRRQARLLTQHQKLLLPKARHLVPPQGKQEVPWAKVLCWDRDFLRRLNSASELEAHQLQPAQKHLAELSLRHLRLQVLAHLLLA
jgi:hypothetical protein